MKDSRSKEALIKNAAKSVILRQGLRGTRLQQIALEAGVSTTSVHYYFRNKEMLFAEVWKDFFPNVTAWMTRVGRQRVSIFEKLQSFALNYLGSTMHQPEMDLLMFQEFSSNNAFYRKIIQRSKSGNPIAFLFSEVEHVYEKGLISGYPKQIFITLISMCMFPFGGILMVKAEMRCSEQEFASMVEARKQYFLQFLSTCF